MSKKIKVETTTKVGRGRKPSEIKFPRGSFTIKELFALNDTRNGGTIKCELTVRQKVNQALKTGTLSPMDPIRKATVGAPTKRYITTSALESAKKASAASRNRKVKVAVAEKLAKPETAPVTEAVEVTA